MKNEVASKRIEGPSHMTFSGQSPGQESSTQREDVSVRLLSLEEIKIDQSLQSRAAISDEAVMDYADLLTDGHDFPPVTVFKNEDRYLLADGFHRILAHKRVGRTHIVADVKSGDRRKALLFSINSNIKHGLTRTNADKRKVVHLMLEDSEWSGMSNGIIARTCGVSDRFVATLRAELASANASEIPRTTVALRNGQEYEIRLPMKPATPSKDPKEVHASLLGSLQGLIAELDKGHQSAHDELLAAVKVVAKQLSLYRKLISQAGLSEPVAAISTTEAN